MSEKIKIKNLNLEIDKGTTIEDLIKEKNLKSDKVIVAAKVNNRIEELTYILDKDCFIEFVDVSTEDGVRIYIRGLTFIFIRACKEIFPESRITIEHSMSKGLYCEVHGDFTLSPSKVQNIKRRMKQIIDNDEPFIRYQLSNDDASEVFKDMGFTDKLEIIKFRPENYMNLYKCGWMSDYFYGYMVPSTGYLKLFDLIFYLPGVIIQHPTIETDGKIPKFVDSPKIYKIFRDATEWSQSINIWNIGELNNKILAGDGGDLIRICESYQENQIASIAQNISDNIDRIKLILIAGPSSSGKTTFAQRLRVQLMVRGLNPVPISMDDYFINREEILLDEKGERDLESIDIIDIELFNEQITSLIQGEEVNMPSYNFHTGQREYNNNIIHLEEDQLIIVEGIHGLNEKLTSMVPLQNKFKIYISALTQINLDDHNRIPTTDTRLIRRMVRDHQFRGASIKDTLDMWYKVRRGEEKNIFPYQEQADIMLNTALIYELAVLKPFILPLLDEIKKDDPHYIEINRLKKFMKYFVTLDSEEIPNNSILREFIGGSCF